MAYVQVPRDLTKYESKLAFNLTKRQIICFSIGIVLGLPSYFFFKSFLPIDIATILTTIIMFPFFAIGIFKKDNIPLEKYVYLVIRQKYLRRHKRIYKQKNKRKVG